MIFSEIHRRFIAPHLLRQTQCIPNDALILLCVADTPAHENVQHAFRMLREQVAVPLRLHLARPDSGDLWPLLTQAALLICDRQKQPPPWHHRAMGADVPVVEAASAHPAELAARLRAIIEEPAWRRRLVLEQRAALETLSAEALRTAFGAEPAEPPESRIQTGGWRIEGPFDSSFSLAIVNRSLALELERQGPCVSLGSIDADGPRPADPAFLADEPKVEAMWHRSRAFTLPDVVTRNLWPPHVLDMRGLHRVMANYAWEESGFPPQDVAAFNATLNLITVTSHFVTKVLRDNGVHVPIAMVGNGIFEPPQQMAADICTPRPYRYLHISSCYPRKGADVLLAAWAQGFTQEDHVELVIKTFPNPFNSVAAQINLLKETWPNHAPILLIEEDISEERIHQLYASADAVVCPARGEGFGLPMAEAFAHGKPVVTTGFSGQRDFCTPETAWLCDFRFAYSRAHLGMSVSVWAEPDVASLVKAMRAVRDAPPEEVQARVAKGQALLKSTYNWQDVARKTRHALEMVERMEPAILHHPKIGWLAPWNPRHPVSQFSARPSTLEEYETNSEADAVYINDYHRPVSDIAERAEKLEARGICVFIFLHEEPDANAASFSEYSRLSCATRIIVHSAYILNILKDMGLVENVTLLPLGLPAPFAGDRMAARRELGLEEHTVLATCGPAHPHKGLREMIRALALLRHQRPRLHLLMLHEKTAETAAELEACRQLMRAEGLCAHVTLVDRALSETEQMAYLTAADIAVFPTQADRGSVDRDVRCAIAAGVPCACTNLPIFDDVSPVIQTLPGFTADALADGLAAMLADDIALKAQIERQTQWAEQITWPIIANRMDGMVRGLVLDRRMTSQVSRSYSRINSIKSEMTQQASGNSAHSTTHQLEPILN